MGKVIYNGVQLLIASMHMHGQEKIKYAEALHVHYVKRITALSAANHFILLKIAKK